MIVFNLDTLAPVGEIPNTRANGAAVDAKSGHGFASSKPVAMWDTKTLALIKTIDIDPKSSPDGILADPFNQRIYVFSHPTADATVIDAKDGTVLGTVDLGGAPEQAASDGQGHVYVVIQDKANVAVVDAKTMKVTAHYDFGDKGSRCNGLALDIRNHVLFAACGQSGIPAVTPAAAPDGNSQRGRRQDHHLAAAGRRFRWRGLQSRDDGSLQFARQRHHDDRQGKQSDELRGGTGSPDDGGRQDADAGYEDEPHPDHGRGVWPAPATTGRAARRGRAATGTRRSGTCSWTDAARFVLDSCGGKITQRAKTGLAQTLKFLFAPVLAFLLSQVLVAQTASLRGQITDQSGAVIPGARVTLQGQSGPVKSTVTDNNGVYTFAALTPGDYTVQASAPELSLAQPVKVTLRAGSRSLNLVLKVASISEKLTVQDAPGPALTTDSSNSASAVVLRGADLDALSDSPDDLAADLSALAGPSAGPNGGAIFVDGFSGGQLPPKESIREIRINQNPFSPEYDKLGYGKIEIFTKPGSDKYRGTAQWNYANDFWNTRNPYSPNKAPFLLNEFEGNAGGPLTRKSSFTIDAQRNMVDNGSITNAVTLDPQTLAAKPFTGILTTPGRFTNISPRVDYQLGANNTLMFRYGITHSDVRDNGIGGFDLISRGYHSQFTNQTVQAADTVLIGSLVNETRFQFYRSATQALANSLSSGDSGAAILQRRRHSAGAHVRHAEQLRTAELQLDAERPALLAVRCAAARANRRQRFAAEFQRDVSRLAAARWRPCWMRRTGPCRAPTANRSWRPSLRSNATGGRCSSSNWAIRRR